MRVFIISILLFYCSIHSALTQSPIIDSLKNELSKADNEQSKFDILLSLAYETKQSDLQSSYLGQAFELAKDEELKAQLFYRQGIIFYRQGDKEASKNAINKSITYWENVSNDTSLANAYYRVGRLFKVLNLLDSAIISMSVAVEKYRRLQNTDKLAQVLNSLGIMYKNVENYTQALQCYFEAYRLAKKNKDKNRLSDICLNIGVVFKSEGRFEDALDYYFKAEELYLELVNNKGLADTYNNIGNILRRQKKYDLALKYYILSVDYRKKLDQQKRLAYAYNNIGLTYLEMDDYKESISHLKKAIQLKKQHQDFRSLTSSYLTISEAYLELGDDKNYLKYSDLGKKLAMQYSQGDLYRKIVVNNSRFAAEHDDFELAYYNLKKAYIGFDTINESSQRIVSSVLAAHFNDEQNRSRIIELNELNEKLASKKEKLEDNQHLASWLIFALVVAILVLIVAAISWFRKQKAYAQKSEELEKTNNQLHETMIRKEEKDVLLKEVHHRVKNNLQIVKSLARLQITGTENQLVKTVLTDFEQRVSTMALVHESLYKSPDFSGVNVADYYTELIEDLIAAYRMNNSLKTELDIEVDNLGLDTLIPLGLLTNEIISNSLKHAFDNGDEGIVRVRFKKISEEDYELFIGDNGKGFNFAEVRSDVRTLGIELIQTLVEQLEGSLDFIPKNGSYYRIRFKSQEKKKE